MPRNRLRIFSSSHSENSLSTLRNSSLHRISSTCYAPSLSSAASPSPPTHTKREAQLPQSFLVSQVHRNTIVGPTKRSPPKYSQRYRFSTVASTACLVSQSVTYSFTHSLEDIQKVNLSLLLLLTEWNHHHRFIQVPLNRNRTRSRYVSRELGKSAPK